MQVIDKHILLEWLKTFIVTLAVILSFLILQDMYNNLIDLINLNASFKDIVRYYYALTPSFLPFTIPLSLFVSLLYSLGHLHKNLEIIALRASGLSLLRISRMLWLSAGILTLLLFWLNSSFVPKSVELSRTIQDNLRFAQEAKNRTSDTVGIIPNLSFDNQPAKRLWFMNRFSEYTYQGYGVTVHIRNALGQEVKRTVASEAYYDDVLEHWVFLKGREVTFDPEAGEPLKSAAFDKKLYPELTERPNVMKALKKPAESLSLREINLLLRSMPIDNNPQLQAYAVQKQRTLATPFACLVVVAIAVPFATSGVRTNPMIGVSKAVGLFAAYYCVASLTGFLGSHLGLAPTLAVWIPNILMIGVALYLHRASA